MNPPTSTPLTHCQRFQARFADLNTQIEELNAFLQTFTSTTDASIAQTVKGKADSFHIPQDFMAEFQARTREILTTFFKNYFKKPKELQQFLNQLNFEENGRVICTVPPLYREGERVTYFPNIIRKVEGDLDLFETRIRILESLEEIEGSLIVRGKPIWRSEQNEWGSITFSKFKAAPKLVRVKNDIDLSLTNIKDFRKAFPALKQVGKRPPGTFSNTSITLTSTKLKRQIEELIYQGELQCEGEIWYIDRVPV